MKELTKEVVVGLWQCLQEEFGSEVKHKDDSAFMERVGGFLDLIGVLDKDAFMDNYATTIFDTIYLPFDIGDFSVVSPLSQVALAVHEHEHVVQYDGDPVEFCFMYMATKSSRAHWEAEAYRTGMELIYKLTGTMPNADYVARKILNYGCGDDEVQYIRQFLLMSQHPMKHGAIISDVTHRALTFLADA
jgi:hypothetical protein